MIAQVALPLPINKLFSYSLPPETATFTKPLSRIKVPFNNRSLTGFVLRLEEGDGVGLKQAQELLDCVPLVDDVCFDLCSWAAGYYVAPIGLALKYALSSSIKIEKYCVVRTEDPSVGHLNGMTLKKACVLAGKETIFSHFHHSAIRLCDVFTGKALETGSHEVKAAESRPMLYLAAVEDRKEYYLSLISRRLDEGKNVLMLLPDYRAVGGFFYDLFSRAFPGAVFWYGSSIPEKRRAETYFRARVERGRLILGSKSAVFLPLAANDLIIVERPEEDEYRNEEGFKFNAVRLAMKRAEIEGIPVVLGSAAPPVELMKSAEEGLVEIGQGRAISRPAISFVTTEKGRGREAYMPEALMEVIAEGVARGENTVIHTPRKAYAAHLYCAACARPLLCPKCKSVLTYHAGEETITCHSCKSLLPYEERCAHCGSTFIRFFEVGAEYLEAELKKAFPDTAVVRVTGEQSGSRRDFRRVVDLSGTGKGCIIVGTHVLSRVFGLKADHLILYGWEDALKTGGYRSREKMFQTAANLLDALKPAKLSVCVHGKTPPDQSFFLGDGRFYEDELQKRRIAEFPPYVRFFLVNIVKRSERAGERVMDAIQKLAEKEKVDHRMLGPIEVKGQYGWRVILKGDETFFSGFLPSLYRLPGVHIEPDPLYV